MAVRKAKWYANKWTYIIGIILVVISYFAFTEGPEYFNLNSYLKQINKDNVKQIEELTVKVEDYAKQIKKLKETNSKITITDEKQKIKRLESELKALLEKEKLGLDNKQLSPEELKIYFNNIINKHK